MIIILPLTTSCFAAKKDDQDKAGGVLSLQLDFDSKGEFVFVVRDAKGSILEGVQDERPITKINRVKTFT